MGTLAVGGWMAETKLHIPINMPLLLLLTLGVSFESPGRNGRNQERNCKPSRPKTTQNGEIGSHISISKDQGAVNFAWPDFPAAVFTTMVMAAPDGTAAGA